MRESTIADRKFKRDNGQGKKKSSRTELKNYINLLRQVETERRRERSLH